MNVAPTMVRRWVAVYTRGLSPQLRNARRTEIESDLWAHAEEAHEDGHGPTALELEMVTRLVLGIPADVAWRWSHRSDGAVALSKDVSIREPRSRHALTAMGIALALFDLLGGVATLLNVVWVPTGDERVAVIAIYATLSTGAVIALVGLLLVARVPVVGGRMAIIGGTLVGGVFLFMPWILLLGLVLGLPLIVIGAVRRRQVLESREPKPA